MCFPHKLLLCFPQIHLLERTKHVYFIGVSKGNTGGCVQCLTPRTQTATGLQAQVRKRYVADKQIKAKVEGEYNPPAPLGAAVGPGSLSVVTGTMLPVIVDVLSEVVPEFRCSCTISHDPFPSAPNVQVSGGRLKLELAIAPVRLKCKPDLSSTKVAGGFIQLRQRNSTINTPKSVVIKAVSVVVPSGTGAKLSTTEPPYIVEPPESTPTAEKGTASAAGSDEPITPYSVTSATATVEQVD
ncbi:hypothetical protein BD779DRAFT_1701561 [Infundibulicybe gibba]|nr:hypothetical protein BD779DRAFT_1701561 [Infundibulicybe gibba]